jgi:hypothetical protein
VDIPHILLQVSKYVSALAMCSINISWAILASNLYLF